MCGITGWVNFKKNLEEEEKQIKQMTNTLEHRGPDDKQIWLDRHVAFGHTRLAVIDPAFGKQPMSKECRRSQFTIVYNGELYNTEQLRLELKSLGHHFTTNSDTEVLLTSFIEWKEKCLEKLNGIFAFAIWDKNKERLFMARDRLGVKPLFYAIKQEGLIFGSELKALLSNRYIDSHIDLEGLKEIFALSPSRTPGHGVFSDISELRPAHAMVFDKDNFKIWRYWQVKSSVHKDSKKVTALKVHDLLKDAVQRQLVSDVPICTFLSGGIDSSALTAFASKKLTRKEGYNPLNTYSISYEENERYFSSNNFQPTGDKQWIDVVSNQFGTTHHQNVISIETLVNYLKEAVYVRDLPGMADIDSSLLWFCKQIKKNATVAQSGECADEIFGGYPWFYREELMNRPYFPWMDSINLRERLLREPWKSKLQLEDYVRFRYQESIQETPYLEGEKSVNKQRREISYLNMIWFMTTLLDRKDRMSMGASLEVRVPFADHNLVEYVWNIPAYMKWHNQQEKWILRKALEDVLPDAILNRKKNPYPKTYHPKYSQAVATWVQTEILDDPNAPLLEFIQKDTLEDLVKSKGTSIKTPFFGQLMSGPQLLAHLGQVNTWLKKYDVKIKY
ncbi:asparagine synthase (glutamine-hydrolyzing) [Natranaerobius thermophilus]|uniref:asparagine synthase (glutamine-hydrolyzing) n=1 Tax=Natranaerobius thermophilus (strain ATCC BAA-1301 / DSM 18059 / JW/NM-WN-LF) TaxID=457570 RepID=B2A0I3_NATTJ|nr:asparagine synthase (glutamine-hydrolyzing) [Natranaerobius thermophilus]ACB84544.1 asparagine synthase (glutamine-hydrolyzing) [Natranaerobius thermophilus JW/NM-WN-LF]